MAYAIEVRAVEARRFAAVRARVPMGGVAGAWRAPLDRVWAFLRARPALRPGHNVFVYHHDGDGERMTVDFGVEVADPFVPGPDADGVQCLTTPAGLAVVTIHRGAYDGLREAHAALIAWCRGEGRRVGDASWERYGDWREDPAALETEVGYLLS